MKKDILKNIADLEYKKLLNEHNAALITLVSLTLGILIFSYDVTKDVFSSLLFALITYLFLTIRRDEVIDKLNNKIDEVRALFGIKT